MEGDADVPWSIDCADAYSVAKARRSAIAEVRKIAGTGADLFMIEVVLGELLAAEMERGHYALVLDVERDIGGPAVHVYTQGTPSLGTAHDEIRGAILHSAPIPMSIEKSAQGTHICLRVPMPHERSANPKLWERHHARS